MVTERRDLDIIMAEVLAYLWMVEDKSQRAWAQQVLEAMEAIYCARVMARA